MNLANFSRQALQNELIDKLKRRVATIGIVGLGYVGLPLACALPRGIQSHRHRYRRGQS